MELINLYARILFSGKACELFHRVSSASLICCELPLMCHGRYRHLEGLTGSSAGVRLYGVCVRNGEPVTFLAPRPPCISAGARGLLISSVRQFIYACGQTAARRQGCDRLVCTSIGTGFYPSSLATSSAAIIRGRSGTP